MLSRWAWRRWRQLACVMPAGQNPGLRRAGGVSRGEADDVRGLRDLGLPPATRKKASTLPSGTRLKAAVVMQQ